MKTSRLGILTASCAVVLGWAAGLLVTPAPAWAQPAAEVIPWVGERGISETVAQIMARDALLPRMEGTPPVVIKADERRGPDRSQLPQDPDAPAVSRWPVPPEGAVFEAGEAEGRVGPRAPQSVGVTFKGPRFGDTVGYVPPDSMGDVGPTQILSVANGRIKVYSKTGTLGALNTTMDSFFSSVRGGSGTSDPRIRFDWHSQRWIVICINVASTNNRCLIAVSSGAIITGTTSFTFYFFQHNTVSPAGDTGKFMDYPTLGVDANALYIGGNMFGGPTGSVFVVRKSSILSGGPIVATANRNNGIYTPQGVTNYDTTIAEGYIVGVHPSTFSRVLFKKVTNPGGTPSFGSNITVTVPTTTNPQAVPALGTTGNLDAIDDRLYMASIFKDKLTGEVSLWTAHHFEVSSSGVASTSGNRVGSRWYQFINLTGTPSLKQSGTVFDPTTGVRNYWFPSLAMSGQGHMAIAFSGASAAERAQVWASGRLASDTLGGTQAVELVQSSTTAYNIEGGGTQRWGDYSYTGVDPTDDMTFWTFQEYCDASNSWAVRCLQLKAPPPATPESCSPPSLPQGAAAQDVVVTGTSTSGSGFFDSPAALNHIGATILGGGVTVNSVTFDSPTQITLNLTVDPAAATGPRTLAVTNPDGQTSAGAVFGVDAGGCTAPAISGQPEPQTVCEGLPATFTVTATGTTPEYQWRKGGADIAGATSSSYTIDVVTPGDADIYTCFVSNGCGSVESDPAQLTVNGELTPSLQPEPLTVCEGETASFTFMASGTPEPAYQWKKDGFDIPGATSDTYTIAAAAVIDTGSYWCEATNPCGTITSDQVQLTVHTPAAIVTGPASQTIAEGDPVTFTVVASGTPAPTYQWYKDAVIIDGATADTYTIAAVTPDDQGAYAVVVTNSCGTQTSEDAVLTVTGPDCPADLNGDGLVDFADYLEFLTLYDAQDLAVDFNMDGLVDFADYLEFLTLYDVGC